MKLTILLITSFCFTAVFSQKKNEKLDGFLNQSGITWKQYQTAHYNFFVEAHGYADNNIHFIKNNFEAERNNIISFFEAQKFTDTANIIIVDTKEKVKTILGFEVQGFAIPENNIVIFLHSKDYSLAAKHELTHYYSFHIWGKPADNWFSEGLAVYSDKKWSGYQIDSLAKHLKDNNKLFKMSILSKKFHSLDPMITYPQIGSFTGFLLAEYGKAKMKELWIKGFKEIKSVYGKSQKKLEEAWLYSLNSIHSENIDYSSHLK